MRCRLSRQAGVALLASLGLAGVLAVLGGLFLRPSLEELTLVEKDGRRLQALALAEAGLADAIVRLGEGRVAFQIDERPAPTGAYSVEVEPEGEGYEKFLIRSEGAARLGGGRKLSQYVYATVGVQRAEESYAWRLLSWKVYSRPPKLD